MPLSSDESATLKELQAEVARQKTVIAQLQSAIENRGTGGKGHLRYLLILAAVALILGSLGAYQYYRVLQSVIDQFPH